MTPAEQIVTRQLIRDEGGYRLKPYHDTEGFLTIGVGRCLELDGITQDEAELLFQHDIEDAVHACERAFPTWLTISPARQAALLNMAFNLGLPHLMTFVKVRQYVGQENWPSAAREVLRSKWATQVGLRALRIARQLETGVEQ
jgi:lysozyme